MWYRVVGADNDQTSLINLANNYKSRLIDCKPIGLGWEWDLFWIKEKSKLEVRVLAGYGKGGGKGGGKLLLALVNKYFSLLNCFWTLLGQSNVIELISKSILSKILTPNVNFY